MERYKLNLILSANLPQDHLAKPSDQNPCICSFARHLQYFKIQC